MAEVRRVKFHQVSDCRSELKSIAPVLASVNCENVLTLSPQVSMQSV